MTWRFYIWALLNFWMINGIIEVGFARFSSVGFYKLFLFIINFPTSIVLLLSSPKLYSSFITLTRNNIFVMLILEGILTFILGYIQWFVLIPYWKKKRERNE